MAAHDIQRKPVERFVAEGGASPSLQSSAQAEHNSWSKPWFGKQKKAGRTHLAKQFDGSWGYNGYFYRRPARRIGDTEHDAGEIEADDDRKYVYRNELGQSIEKRQDVTT